MTPARINGSSHRFNTFGGIVGNNARILLLSSSFNRACFTASNHFFQAPSMIGKTRTNQPARDAG
jgi:hypothetical protein